MMLQSVWLNIAFVLASVIGLLAVLAYYQRRARPHPELIRKAMHVGSGLIALTLPWLFDTNWPVLLLAVLASAGMFAVKSLRGLQNNLGAVTGSVVRKTSGEICFPLGAGILFVLAQDDLLLYSIPILILTFADASAALIGVFYGVRRYTTDEGAKTLEGSLAFFQAAFLSTLVPLLLFTETGRPETLMISLVMGVLSMLLDATAWWGLDNLLIPVFSFMALKTFLTIDLRYLVVQFVLTLILIGFVALWRKRTTLNDSAMLFTVIYGYLCWTLGGWAWMLPPFLLFLTYNSLSPRDVEPQTRPYTVPIVLAVGAVGLAWLLLANALDLHQPLYFPYMLSFATQLAMIGSARHQRAGRRQVALKRLAWYSFISWLLLFVPFVWVEGLKPGWWLQALVALLSVGMGVGLFALTQSGAGGYRNVASRWVLQTLCAGLASLVGLAIVQLS
jgi:phytol kinase